MTMGEKLSKLRKENNITQEQLADTLGVSRQSVSKWESDLAYPETEKLIRLSDMFQCSLDYLLKEEAERTETPPPSSPSVRRVTREDASRFLEARQQTAWPTAIATLLCILSPICLILLSALSEEPNIHLSENTASGMGMAVLLLFVACAVVIFIFTGKRTDVFRYLENETFETECGVCEWVRQCRETFRPVHTRYNAAGVCLCILSAVPLFIGVILQEDNDLLTASMFCLLLAIVGTGVLLLVRAGTVWSGFEQLLQEDDYTRVKKVQAPILRTISVVYWLLVTAAYLTWGFLLKFSIAEGTGGWHKAAIIWPVAGVVFPAILAVCKLFTRRK